MRSKLQGLVVALVVALSAVLAHAQEDVIPTTGVDVGEFIVEAITKLGIVAGVAIGGYFAFLLLKKGLKWVRQIG